MKELSLNVLDITKNSVKAGATLIDISLVEVGSLLTMTITDNGCGMKPEVVETVMNPFYTTRTTRKVGMGVPLLMLAAEQTGGTVTIQSRHEEEHPEDHGTVVTATFHTDHIDFTPIGDSSISRGFASCRTKTVPLTTPHWISSIFKIKGDKTAGAESQQQIKPH